MNLTNPIHFFVGNFSSPKKVAGFWMEVWTEKVWNYSELKGYYLILKTTALLRNMRGSAIGSSPAFSANSTEV